jgi:hypothetical protein
MIWTGALCVLKSFKGFIEAFVRQLVEILDISCKLSHLARGQILTHEHLYKLIPRVYAFGRKTIEPELGSQVKCKLDKIESDDIRSDINIVDSVAQTFELSNEQVRIFIGKATKGISFYECDVGGVYFESAVGWRDNNGTTFFVRSLGDEVTQSWSDKRKNILDICHDNNWWLGWWVLLGSATISNNPFWVEFYGHKHFVRRASLHMPVKHKLDKIQKHQLKVNRKEKEKTS